MFLFLGVFIRIAGEASKRQVSLMNSLISQINEVLKGIKVIKAMNLGSLVSPILLQETDSIRDAQQKQVVAKHGLSYLCISHDLRIIRALSDLVYVMKDGLIIENGVADQVFNEPNNEYTKQLITAAIS